MFIKIRTQIVYTDRVEKMDKNSINWSKPRKPQQKEIVYKDVHSSLFAQEKWINKTFTVIDKTSYSPTVVNYYGNIVLQK